MKCTLEEYEERMKEKAGDRKLIREEIGDTLDLRGDQSTGPVKRAGQSGVSFYVGEGVDQAIIGEYVHQTGEGTDVD